MRRERFLAAVLALLPLAIAGAASQRVLVICAPGYPGTTAQAKPVMDAFAAAAASAAGLPAGSLAAVYFEKEEPGMARLAQDDAAFALVPLPFLLQHAQALKLEPRLAVVRASGATETWSLVAKKGAVKSAASLDGWEIAGSAGYAPAFVRGTVLGPWGALPASASVKFTPAILSALRRAAAGENVAVLLDGAQASALGSLPFAGDLETVYRSRPLPGTILCTVGGRATGADGEALLKALPTLHEKPGGKDVLETLQMVRFEKADLGAIEEARKAFARASGSPQ